MSTQRSYIFQNYLFNIRWKSIIRSSSKMQFKLLLKPKIYKINQSSFALSPLIGQDCSTDVHALTKSRI